MPQELDPGSAPVPVQAGSGELAVRVPQAARAAALRTALASLVVAGHLPFWFQGAAETLFQGFRSLGFGWGGTLSLGNGVLVLGAILLTRLMATAVAPVVRDAAARSRDEGRAAAAGACMASVALCGVAIGIGHLLDLHHLGSTALWLLLLRLGASALGVGLFGAQLFREVGDRSGLGPAPRLYSFLARAGVATVVGLFALGALGLAPSGLGAMAFLAGSGLLAGATALGGGAPGPVREALPDGG